MATLDCNVSNEELCFKENKNYKEASAAVNQKVESKIIKTHYEERQII